MATLLALSGGASRQWRWRGDTTMADSVGGDTSLFHPSWKEGRSSGFNSGGGFNTRVEGHSGGAPPRAMRAASTPATLLLRRHLQRICGEGGQIRCHGAAAARWCSDGLLRALSMGSAGPIDGLTLFCFFILLTEAGIQNDSDERSNARLGKEIL